MATKLLLAASALTAAATDAVGATGGVSGRFLEVMAATESLASLLEHPHAVSESLHPSTQSEIVHFNTQAGSVHPITQSESLYASTQPEGVHASSHSDALHVSAPPPPLVPLEQGCVASGGLSPPKVGAADFSGPIPAGNFRERGQIRGISMAPDREGNVYASSEGKLKVLSIDGSGQQKIRTLGVSLPRLGFAYQTVEVGYLNGREKRIFTYVPSRPDPHQDVGTVDIYMIEDGAEPKAEIIYSFSMFEGRGAQSVQEMRFDPNTNRLFVRCKISNPQGLQPVYVYALEVYTRACERMFRFMEAIGGMRVAPDGKALWLSSYRRHSDKTYYLVKMRVGGAEELRIRLPYQGYGQMTRDVLIDPIRADVYVIGRSGVEQNPFTIWGVHGPVDFASNATVMYQSANVNGILGLESIKKSVKLLAAHLDDESALFEAEIPLASCYG